MVSEALEQPKEVLMGAVTRKNESREIQFFTQSQDTEEETDI